MTHITHIFTGVDVAIVVDCPICAQNIYTGKLVEAGRDGMQSVADEAKRVAQAHMQCHDIPYWQQTTEERQVIASAQTRLTRSQEAFPDDWRTRFTFYDGDVADVLAVIESLRGMVRDALATDGTHHKQWYLQQIARSLGVVGDWPEGIAP